MSDDYTSNLQTTGTVAVGGSATGEIESSGDRDWFAVTLEAGKAYRIDLEGSRTGAGTLSDPYLRGIHDADGNLIAGTDDDDGGAGRNSRLYFEPASAGTYYIAAGAYRSRTGTYEVSVTEADDDHLAGTGTTGTVAVDGSATGTIGFANDRDWFSVTLEAGKSYRIDLEGSPTGAGTLNDPYLRGVHDADGNPIAGSSDDDGGIGPNSRLVFNPETSGTYYIVTGTWSDDDTGTYRVSVAELERTDDHPAGTGTTGTVAVAGSAEGEIESARDQDWFAVTLEAGVRYRIDLEGSRTGAWTLGDPHLRGVYDADGDLIGGTADDNGGTGRNSRLLFEPESDGTYYIAAGGEGSHTGTYRVSVREVADDDHPAGTGTTGTVEVGGSATGSIERSGDRDWFAVTLEAGKAYRIDLEGSPTDAGTLSDPYLRGVHDADGTLIDDTSDDDAGTGTNSRLYFEPDSAGTYYVAAGAYGRDTGTYRVSATEIATDGHPAGTGTTGTVAVGGSAAGAIESSRDEDWFAVTLSAGTRYRIDLEGLPTDAGTLSDPYLRGVHDAGGNRIGGTTNDDGGVGRNSRLFFEPETAGTYYIAAGAYEHRTGTYRVSVTEVTDTDLPAGTGTTGTVEVGGSATGDIERSGDRDWLAVTLEAGKTYRIDLEGSRTNAGTLWDPYLYGIHDANGSRIGGTSDDDGGVGQNSRVLFEPESAGTYYIAAGAYGHHTGTYELSVEEVL